MAARHSADDHAEVLRLLRESLSQLRLARDGARYRRKRSANPWRWEHLWLQLRICHNSLEWAINFFLDQPEGECDG